MTRLLPHLAFDACESPVSYTARLARFHVGFPVVPFLRDVDIAPEQLASSEPVALERLAAVSGTRVDILKRNAPVRCGGRQYDVRGEVVSSEFLSRPFTVFCPYCLADQDVCGPRFSHWTWAFSVVRTCSVHGTSLLRRKAEEWDGLVQGLDVVVPERGAALFDLGEGQGLRAVSPLQNYVLARLDGQDGPAWLDSQTLDQAVRGTELLGVLVAYGPEQLLPKLTVDQWDHAGSVGFQFTSRGENGIREALAHRLREFAETGKKPGTRSLFGCFYNALAHSKSLKEPGDIARITREFIWDHLPMAAGEKTLGAELPRRRLHTVASLAKQEQLETRSLRNLLTTARVIAPKAPSHFAFPAPVGEEVARRVKRTEKLKDLPVLLNCARPLAENLVADRWLELIYHDHTDSQGRAHKTVLSEDVRRILDELEAAAQSVAGPELELAPLSKVAERTRLSAIQVLGLVLGGHLKKVSLAEGERGIGGLRLSSEEVKAVAKRVLTGWSNEQVCSFLMVSREACVDLTQLDDVDVRLPSYKVRGIDGGRDIIRFDPQKLAEFHATFATVRRIGELTGRSARETIFWLKNHRVKPAISEAAVGIPLYRIAKLPSW